MMRDDELRAIEARAEAATPGPWTVDDRECRVLRAPNAANENQSLMGDEQYYPWTPDRDEDWQFIAHARTDVPALIMEVRQLQEMLVIALRPEAEEPYVHDINRAMWLDGKPRP